MSRSTSAAHIKLNYETVYTSNDEHFTFHLQSFTQRMAELQRVVHTYVRPCVCVCVVTLEIQFDLFSLAHRPSPVCLPIRLKVFFPHQFIKTSGTPTSCDNFFSPVDAVGLYWVKCVSHVHTFAFPSGYYSAPAVG